MQTRFQTNMPPSRSPPQHSAEILSQVQAFLDEPGDSFQATLKNVDPETFRVLEQKGDGGDPSGWDSVRCISYISNWLSSTLTVIVILSITTGKTY
jgi:hypothetical protein